MPPLKVHPIEPYVARHGHRLLGYPEVRRYRRAAGSLPGRRWPEREVQGARAELRRRLDSVAVALDRGCGKGRVRVRLAVPQPEHRGTQGTGGEARAHPQQVSPREISHQKRP